MFRARPRRGSTIDPAPRSRTRRRSSLESREADPRPRPPWLLLAGAAFGLGLASLGLLEDRSDPTALPDDAAAIVGSHKIRRVDYERVLAGVAGDLRGPVDETMRRRVLERMIDEELLVQRALEMGLAAIDRRVRGDLTSGLIDSIVADADSRAPTAREVARHYEENRDFFTRPGRLRARTLYFSGHRDSDDPRGDAATRAARARDRLLGGEPIEAVEGELADRQVSPVPNALLPPAKVRDYVGPTILETLMTLEADVWSEPIESGGGHHLARVLERESALVPPLEEIEPLVRQDLVRRRGDEALRAYLDDLRTRVPIQVDEGLFSGVDAEPEVGEAGAG